MTLDERISACLGEESFSRIKAYTFSDTARAVMGDGRYESVKLALYASLVGKDHGGPWKNTLAKKMYVSLKELSRETYYSFVVDAIAQNVASLIYLFNDKYA